MKGKVRLARDSWLVKCLTRRRGRAKFAFASLPLVSTQVTLRNDRTRSAMACRILASFLIAMGQGALINSALVFRLNGWGEPYGVMELNPTGRSARPQSLLLYP